MTFHCPAVPHTNDFPGSIRHGFCPGLIPFCVWCCNGWQRDHRVLLYMWDASTRRRLYHPPEWTDWRTQQLRRGRVTYEETCINSEPFHDHAIGMRYASLYFSGDNYRVQLSQFQQLYDLDPTGSNYTLPLLTEFRRTRFNQSIANNPYFCIPFGVVAGPATYLLTFHFMSNKSTEYTQGLLDGEMLKSFFSITGPDEILSMGVGSTIAPS